MKRIFGLLIVLVLIFTFEGVLADTYKVTTEETPINVRAEPQGQIIGIIRKDKEVEVLRMEKFDGCNWAVVEFNGVEAYLYAFYLTPVDKENDGVAANKKVASKQTTTTTSKKNNRVLLDGADPTIKPDEYATLYQVNAKGGLNIRHGPGSIRYHIKAVVKNQAFLWVLGISENGKWAHVEYGNGEYGYVDTQYLVPVLGDE